MDLYIEKAKELNSLRFSKTTCKFFDYGTSGFRDKATELNFVMFRMGILAVLKSKAEQGCSVGLMITASHNPEEDNGVKLCGPLGEMIDSQWEAFAMELINASDENFAPVLRKIFMLVNCETAASVFLGRDTRPSSEPLLENAMAGITILGGDYHDFGVITTPQLHFLVVCENNESYGEPSLFGYYSKLSDAFKKLRKYKIKRSTKEFFTEGGSTYDSFVFVDGANGVGANMMKELLKYDIPVNIEIFNDGSSGILNYKCGADYVKVDQTFPEGAQIEKCKRYASLDGDADRLVYFYSDENGKFHLLDGDKIASLFAKFFKELIEETGLKLEMSVIQTAYANGKSSSYIRNTLNIPVVCVPTGVKHLHHEAKKYDIAVYFEANGHGTVLFSDKAKREIKALAEDANVPKARQEAAQKLLTSIDLINETVGDAISDLLTVEAILYDYDWGIKIWDAMYKEYACRQLKVKVPDRRVITTVNADRTVTQPSGLQEAINSTVIKYSNARAFVRPSGTEDVVRIYAEAEKQELADALAEEIRSLVVKFTNQS